ncbi:MAG TPA: hypothetical protein VNL98_07095 [Gemmatimonadales bacterium]|nr:hypothetical protein [Gemmatimonadales bacterium]
MPRYEGRGAIVRRLAAVLRYTATSRSTPDPKVIARGLGCHWRTVQRDLDALREAGWPMPHSERTETPWN